MSLKAKLGDDLKEAMRAKDQVRLDTIRSIRGAITQREVDSKKELGDDDILELVRSLRKQRVEAIEQYRAGGRMDLVEKETRERDLLDGYLPAAPDAATISDVVRAVVQELNATGPKDMGKVMQAAKTRLPGVDGKVLSAAVKAALPAAS